jgi:hypothetical protein
MIIWNQTEREKEMRQQLKRGNTKTMRNEENKKERNKQKK